MKTAIKFKTATGRLPLRYFVSAALSAIAILLLISAAVPAFAKDPGPIQIGWTGTYAIDEPAGLTYYQVSAAFLGRPRNPNILSGAGLIAQCTRPPNPNTPYTCETDPSTFETFDATGALTSDPITGETTFTWVVKDPGPELPRGGEKQIEKKKPTEANVKTFGVACAGWMIRGQQSSSFAEIV